MRGCSLVHTWVDLSSSTIRGSGDGWGAALTARGTPQGLISQSSKIQLPTIFLSCSWALSSLSMWFLFYWYSSYWREEMLMSFSGIPEGHWPQTLKQYRQTNHTLHLICIVFVPDFCTWFYFLKDVFYLCCWFSVILFSGLAGPVSTPICGPHLSPLCLFNQKMASSFLLLLACLHLRLTNFVTPQPT